MEIVVRKASDIASDYIESLINQNEYLPGARLPSIKEWAARLDVGVGTIREATNILKTKGLIEVRQGEGTFVRKVDLKEIAPMMNIALVQMNDLEELMDFRNIIEIGAVQLAAQNRTVEELQELKKALDEMETDDREKREKADFHFHDIIAKATHNTLLHFLFQSYGPAIKSLMHRYGIEMPDQNWSDHHLIYQSIEKQDTLQALQNMKKHLTEAKQRAFLDNKNI